MIRDTLVGQLTRAHVLVVAGTCALLVVATTTATAILLRDGQDGTLEAVTLEVADGIEVEAKEEKSPIREAAEEFFKESQLSGYRFELVAEDGSTIASAGVLAGWNASDYEIPVDARAGAPRLHPGAVRQGRFRTCARRCGSSHTVRVITLDVLADPHVRRFGGVLLAALPVAAVFGALIGSALFTRRLRPLGRLEAAAEASAARPDVSLRVEADVREIAAVRDAFNRLLARLGEALAGERRFSQEASHELRTPLAALRGRLERIRIDGPLSAEQAEHVATALREADTLTRLVDALLLLARSESAPLPADPVNLCDIAREVAAQQAARDGAGVPPPEVDAPDEILVRGSDELLARAIANLVENARKFGGPSARIRIRVGRDGTNASAAVADSGPGVPESARGLVFERFHRAAGRDTRVEGVGLGLAVARAIAQRHRGSIELRASDLGGAEFRIVIPLLDAAG